MSEDPFQNSAPWELPPPPAPRPAPRRHRLPWESAELFDHKPPGSDYGYIKHGRPHPCDLIQLQNKVAHGWGRLPLIWTPASPRLIAAAEAPEIYEAVKARLIRRTITAGVRALLIAVGLAGALVIGAHFDGTPLGEVESLALTILFFFGVIPASQAFRSVGVLRTFTLPDILVQGRPARYDFWLRQKKPVATWLIGACIALVAVTQIRAGWEASVIAGGLLKPLPAGEQWRLLTCALLHGNYIHLGVNMFALLVLGRWVEAHSKAFYLPVVFVLTALAGSLASLRFNSYPSVGASGGLMGLIGFLGVMGYLRRDMLPDGFFRIIVANVILICGMGIAAHGVVDNAAHAGGCAAGVALGLLVYTRPVARRAGKYAIIAGVGASLIWIGAAIFMAQRLLGVARLEAAEQAVPAMVKIAPGEMDATAQFTYLYGGTDKFKVLSGRQETSPNGGPTVNILRGVFQAAGRYTFQFEELDEAEEVFQVRVVRAVIAPSAPAGAVFITPDDRAWAGYVEGFVTAPPLATGVVQWITHSPNAAGHWRLGAIEYNAAAR